MIDCKLQFEFDNSNQLSLFVSIMDVFDVGVEVNDKELYFVNVKLANSNRAGLEQIYDIAVLLNSEIV